MTFKYHHTSFDGLWNFQWKFVKFKVDNHRRFNMFIWRSASDSGTGCYMELQFWFFWIIATRRQSIWCVWSHVSPNSMTSSHLVISQSKRHLALIEVCLLLNLCSNPFAKRSSTYAFWYLNAIVQQHNWSHFTRIKHTDSFKTNWLLYNYENHFLLSTIMQLCQINRTLCIFLHFT